MLKTPKKALLPDSWATLVVSLLGLLLAWKWGLAGAAIALIAILVCAVVNWRILLFPGALIPINSVLYLLSWWICRTSGDRYKPSFSPSLSQQNDPGPLWSRRSGRRHKISMK